MVAFTSSLCRSLSACEPQRLEGNIRHVPETISRAPGRRMPKKASSVVRCTYTHTHHERELLMESHVSHVSHAANRTDVGFSSPLLINPLTAAVILSTSAVARRRVNACVMAVSFRWRQSRQA